MQQVLKKNFYNDLKFDKQKIIDNQSLPKNIIFTEYLEHFSIYNLNENIITDKAPQNFRWIGFIKLFFPIVKSFTAIEVQEIIAYLYLKIALHHQ